MVTFTSYLSLSSGLLSRVAAGSLRGKAHPPFPVPAGGGHLSVTGPCPPDGTESTSQRGLLGAVATAMPSLRKLWGQSANSLQSGTLEGAVRRGTREGPESLMDFSRWGVNPKSHGHEKKGALVRRAAGAERMLARGSGPSLAEGVCPGLTGGTGCAVSQPL